ncbi:MAG: STAS domain-containing protein [Acidobacteria bacterium]|nr:STAS domain-containing protein [Acidobacteriota bacterium]
MSTSKLELVERELPGALIIDVVGELTVGSGTETLLEAVRRHVASGRTLILVNLSKCRRVDSSGLGELVTCLVTATRHDAVFRLTSVPQQIRGVMKLTNVLKAFEVYETDEEAAKAAAGNQGAS